MTSAAGSDEPEEAELQDGGPENAETGDMMALISSGVMSLSTGDRAKLRRIFLTGRHDADGVVIGLIHRIGEQMPARADVFATWRLLAHVAALLSGTAGDPSHARRSLGRALHAAGLSETTLLRLAAARGPVLQGQIIRVVRRLAQKGGGPVDLWTVFGLIGSDATRVEEARLRIARDYYAAAARSEGDPK